MKNIFALSMAITLLTGCTSIIQKQTYGDYESKIASGQLEAAVELAVKKANVNQETGQSQDLLWSLESAALLRMQNNYRESTVFFDNAEALMKSEDTENVLESAVNGAGSILINDAMTDYKQAHYDGIMANTYKAMNFMFEGDNANARIEWNRVDERQRRSAEQFAEKIAKLKEEQEKEAARQKEKETANNQTAAETTEQSLSEAEQLLLAQGIDLSQWNAYKDYVNPFSTYMHGLYFMINARGSSDYDKAYSSLKRAASMTDNSTAKADMTLADALRKGKTSVKDIKPAVWVVFENGLGPKKDEIRIDLPIFLASNNINYTGLALPKLVERQQAYTSLNVEGQSTKVLANMDRVVQAEFKAEFPYILTREVTRAVWKTIAQKQLNDQSPMMGLLASAAQIATTSADLRMWNSLPKDFQLTRINKPENGIIAISATGMTAPLQVQLDNDAQFSIVYIRAVSPLSTPVVDVINI